MALIDKEAALADMDYYISAKKLVEDILEARGIEIETVPKLIRFIKAQPRRGINTGDLVSRQEVLEELTVTEEMDTAELLWTLTTRINDLPNIEPEPRRGRWQYVYKWAGSAPCGVCYSVCERQYKIITRYCPNCGARMEEEDEPKPCASCPYNPVEAMIRNGGEDVCPDAFKPVAKYCKRNYNYDCQGMEADE